MYNINQRSSFNNLSNYCYSTQYFPVKVGRKKMHQLSILIDGLEIVIKKSSKKILYTNFSNVIYGAVLRMNSLFNPEKISLSSIISVRPTTQNLSLEFEIVNDKPFRLGNEDYFMSIIGKYSYDNPEKVTYAPIIYRKWCSNGAVSILNEKFKETITIDKINDIGCEWTRCNFEIYKNKLNNYFEYLKNQSFSMERESKLADISRRNNADLDNLIDRVFKPSRKNSKNNLNNIKNQRGIDNVSVNTLLPRYIDRDEASQFAILNAITDFASNYQDDPNLRYNYLNAIGKYFRKEMDLLYKQQSKMMNNNIRWKDITSLF